MPAHTANWRLFMRIPSHGLARPSSTSPVPESSRATAPSRNTRQTSGICKCQLLSDIRMVMEDWRGKRRSPCTLLTFQEAPEDVFGPVRQRIENATLRLRANDESFLFTPCCTPSAPSLPFWRREAGLMG